MTAAQITQAEPTPTPWRYQEKSDAYTHIVRSGDRFIFQLSQDTSGEAEATARLIVRAVNAHAGLVKALIEAERFMAYFANETDGHFSGDGTPTTCLVEIRAALASAGVKP